MILLDHGIMGIALFLCEPSGDPYVFGAAVGGSVFPDLDLVHGRPGTIGYLVRHRTYTHSLIGAPVFALGLAICLSLAGASTEFWVLWAWSLAGLSGHLLLDTLNSFGTMVWYPISRKKVALDTVFEFDPVITGLLGAAVIAEVVAPRAWGIDAFVVAIVVTGFLLMYVAWRLAARLRFRARVLAHIERNPDRPIAISVVPGAYWRWKGVVVRSTSHEVVRAIQGRLRTELRPRISIPDHRLTPQLSSYQNYARHLDVSIDEDCISLQNLIYSPDTYRLDADFGRDGDPKITISLPTLKISDYY